MTQTGYDLRPKGAPDGGRPDEAEVRSELEHILASEDFRASERRRRFLKYVVEAALAGETDRLKGYTIATELFDRGKDFDPQTDPIVRLEASRLRRDLELYYLRSGKHDPIQISIPKGGNTPVFEPRDRVPVPDATGAEASEVHLSALSTAAGRRWPLRGAAGRSITLTAAAFVAVAVIFHLKEEIQKEDLLRENY